MSALRTRIGWLINGGANTAAALQAYGDGLRALQEKVARIDADVQAMRAQRETSDAETARLRAEVAALEGQLRAAVDDLGDRVGHVVERLG
jgi:hypothetical protein